MTEQRPETDPPPPLTLPISHEPHAHSRHNRVSGPHKLSAEGQDVRYLRSTYVPEGEKCYCLFEGESREAVEEVQKRAGLPYEQIHEAAFLTSEDV